MALGLVLLSKSKLEQELQQWLGFLFEEPGLLSSDSETPFSITQSMGFEGWETFGPGSWMIE